MAREKSGFFPTVLRNAALLALAGVVLGSLANALRPSPQPWSADWAHHVEMRARAEKIPLVYLPELKELAVADAESLVDARSAEEYAAGHVPGAASLPADSPEDAFAAFAAAHPLDAPLVAYCRDIDCDDALVLCLALRDRGWTGVRLYPGGFAEWTAYGGAVDPPPADPAADPDPEVAP